MRSTKLSSLENIAGRGLGVSSDGFVKIALKVEASSSALLFSELQGFPEESTRVPIIGI